MQNIDPFRILLSTLPVYLPNLVVCFVAAVVLIVLWRRASSGAIWGLLGFGLLFLVYIVSPVGQAFLQQWVFQDGDRAQRVWAFSAFAFANSAMGAVGHLLLLVAILAGRSVPEPAAGSSGQFR